MKILCVIDSLGSGGAQRQLVELALGFIEIGHDVSFLTYHHIPFFNPILEEADISIECIQEPNYLKRLLKMRRFIRRGKYDSVLSFLNSANFICELAGLPFRNWGLVVSERSANPHVEKSLKIKIHRIFHLFADYIVTNSDTNMRLVQSCNPFLPKSKCRVIYNCIDLRKWKPSTDYSPRKDGLLKLIVVARHRYLKNLSGLIIAINLLNQTERSKLVVEWYGDRITEPYFDNSIAEAKEMIKDYGLDEIILLFPATNDITKRVQKADVVGLFSFYEGFPNSICEGMACAKPVICSNVSDMPKFLAHSKELLFDPSDSLAIKNILSRVLRLSDAQLMQIGSQNEKFSKEYFDRDIVVSKYVSLLRE